MSYVVLQKKMGSISPPGHALEAQALAARICPGKHSINKKHLCIAVWIPKRNCVKRYIGCFIPGLVCNTLVVSDLEKFSDLEM